MPTEGLTESGWQTVGPFFHSTLPWEGGGVLVGNATQGERIELVGTILDGDGAPVSDAMVELWQADAQGRFNHPEDPRGGASDPAFGGFGRTVADAAGRFVFRTIKPGPVPGPGNSQQAPHLDVAIFGRGLSGRLVARVYFAGDAGHDIDPVLGLIDPPARRETLIARPDPQASGRYLWTVHLQGEHETVFFDV